MRRQPYHEELVVEEREEEVAARALALVPLPCIPFLDKRIMHGVSTQLGGSKHVAVLDPQDLPVAAACRG